MAIEARITGNGHFRGSSTNLESYSVTEDSTPSEPGDTTGGTGTIDFGVYALDDTTLLLNDTVELIDNSNGRTQGVINSVNIINSAAAVSANSRLYQTVFDVTAAPYSGTLGGAFTYYLGLAGIVGGIVIDSTITSRTVAYQGFNGNLWDYLKQMAVSERCEISLVSSNIVLRPLNTRILETRKHTSQSHAVANNDLAQFIEIYYYNNKYVPSDIIYPKGGWNSEVPVYQVDANQVLEVDIPVDFSVTSIIQPSVQNSVTKSQIGSVYSVSGNDGLPIPAAQWTAQGGKLVVSINPDSKSLHVKITGPTETRYAPYSIAVQSGPSDRYSSLRILGAGVTFTKTLLTLPTGVPATKTTKVVGITVDNPFIATISQAYDLGTETAIKWATSTDTINISATVVNRAGEVGNLNYPTFQAFNDLYAGQTFTTFNTTWSGLTFQQFDDFFNATVQDNFENQAFGNVAGARTLYRYNWYRVRSASISPEGITYSAERSTTFGDFNTVWSGATFADFNTRWSGYKFEDLETRVLWR